MTSITRVSFTSAGAECAAWHLSAGSDLPGPCVVMAHGLGGTVDAGLMPFAERLVEAGVDVMAFDYRGFGESGGSPRQRVRIADQLDDWRAALHCAASLPGVDASRLVLWGVSLAGGHVLQLASERTDVAAVISVVPLVSGLAAGRHALASHRPTELARGGLTGVRSALQSRLGREPVMMPIVAAPGQPGAMTLEGNLEDYLSIAGPSWRNEVDAAVVLELGSYQPAKAADKITAPVLVQIADFDRAAPPHAAAKAAFDARAEVRHYPGDHFDLFPGKPFFENAVQHQVRFLQRHLGDQHPVDV